MPLGELVAAQRASGAPAVIAASSEAPSSPVVRSVLPLVTAPLAIAPVRAFAKRLLAGQGRPGAWTPAALFGSSLAEACGGEYLIE